MHPDLRKALKYVVVTLCLFVTTALAQTGSINTTTRDASQFKSLQAAINSLPGKGGTVYLPLGDYAIYSSISIGSNITLVGQGRGSRIIYKGTTVQNAGMLQAVFASAGGSNVTIRDLDLIGGSGPRSCFTRGIRIVNAKNAVIDNVQITGIETPVSLPGEAFAVELFSVQYAQVSRNLIQMLPGAITDASFRIGILVRSPMVDNYNGVIAGIAPTPATSRNIVIDHNRVYGGTHGLNLQNVSDAVLSNNTVTDQGDRNVILYATNTNIQVTDNFLARAGSTNLIADFANKGLLIQRNTFDTTTGGEGRNVELYEQNSDVVISSNKMLHAFNDGVFLGYGASQVSISANEISGFGGSGNNLAAGVKVEGTMIDGYPAPPDHRDIDSVSVTSNNIMSSSAATFGIWFSARAQDSHGPDVNIRGTVDKNTISGGIHGVLVSRDNNQMVIDVGVGADNVISATSSSTIAYF
jgi:Pectate lyase superfamily protein